jgi:sterol desaturase/sphingolipid hydroxylase (fatty acid hydroxylase superfamily)
MIDLAVAGGHRTDTAAKSGAARIKGDWVPPELIQPDFHPFFMWPPNPKAIVKFLFRWNGYLWPRPILYFAASWLIWKFVMPAPEVARELLFSWMWPILVFNIIMVALLNSVWHVPLYFFRTQGTEYKYNKRWPGGDNPSFFLRSQLLDNIFWTFVWVVPIMTVWEIFAVWTQASGRSPALSWQEKPLYLTVLVLLIPLWHTVHFHAAHWLLHREFLYKWVHSVHHRNVNAGPWSGLALHPVEAFAFFAPVWLYLLIPSHPLVAIAAINFAWFTATPAHIGFGRVVILPDGRTIDTDLYHHYLHHRYHECNYSGTDLDLWLGTWHDGSVEAHERMRDRIKKRNVYR